MNGNKTELTPDVKMIIVCEKMHWTFAEYEAQPTWFINALVLKWNIENNINKK